MSDLERMRDVCLDWSGIEPRIVLPPILYAVVGRPFVLVFRSVVRLDTGCTFAVTTTPTGTLTATQWSITPGAGDVGSHTFTLTVTTADGRTVTKSCTLKVSAAISSGSRAIVIVGDSIGNGIPAKTAALFGAHASWLGLEDDAGTANETHPGWHWGAFAASDGGSTSYPTLTDASPFRAGGAVDIGAYVTAIGGTPTHLIWHLGTNYIATGDISDIDLRIEQELDYAETLIAAWQAEVAAAKHVLLIPPRGNDDDAIFTSTYAGVIEGPEFRLIEHRVAQRYVGRFAGRTASGIYVVHSGASLSGTNSYPVDNAIHPSSDGYQTIAETVYAALAGM